MPESQVNNLQQPYASLSSPLPTRAIAFDFGTKKIGVAAGNSLTRTAQGIKQIHFNAKAKDQLWNAIEALVREWRPGVLVVGLPLTMDGLESKMTTMAKEFGITLQGKTGIPVCFVDERLSSSAADALLKETLQPGKRTTGKRKNARDSLAAQLILTTYFEENPAS